MTDKKQPDTNSSERDVAASSRAHRDMGSSAQGDGASDTDRNARSGTVESGSNAGSGSTGLGAGDKGGNTGNG